MVLSPFKTWLTLICQDYLASSLKQLLIFLK